MEWFGKKSSARRIGALMIALCMVFTSFAMLSAEPAYAASKTKLSRKSVTLKTGKTCVLKVYNAKYKVKWSTTNKKIASVKVKTGKKLQRVVIKAGKKTGKCYIKAKVGKKVYKCKVVVRKPAVKPDPGNDDSGDDNTETSEMTLSDTSHELTAGIAAEPSQVAEPGEDFALAYTDFAFSLMKKILAAESADSSREGQETSDNLLISPDSVTTALAMTMNGAAGDTLVEMQKTLGSELSAEDYNKYLATVNRRLMSSNEYIYNVTNSIWARENMVDVKDEFLRTNKAYHDAEFYTAPFSDQTVSDMNAWVHNKTRGMINSIINELSKDARMVLINAVAFEGQWAKPFIKENNVSRDFHSADGTSANVSMMRDVDDYQYLELSGGNGFVKNYKGGNKSGIAFVGILPPEGMSADEYFASIDAQAFRDSWNGRKYKDIILTLPKFSYDYSHSMEDVLQEMGMQRAFTDDADFTRMANPTPESPGLHISKVLHKTHIELDENGTKAAAATAVVMEKSSSTIGEKPIELTFDRPFVYMLVDTATGIPLFTGEVRTVK